MQGKVLFFYIVDGNGHIIILSACCKLLCIIANGNENIFFLFTLPFPLFLCSNYNNLKTLQVSDNQYKLLTMKSLNNPFEAQSEVLFTRRL